MSRSFKKRDRRHIFEDGRKQVKKENRTKLNKALRSLDLENIDDLDEKEIEKLYDVYGKS